MKDTLGLERTPKRESSKRLSFGQENEESPKSPQTPSPPTNYNRSGGHSNRRTSVSHGFLASPLPGSTATARPSYKTDFVVPESPGVKTRLLPPTTPKSRNQEVFLSPSPKLKSPGIQKDTERPIRELSNNLKTRLNYAFVKLQNGWTDKTLPQLESVVSDAPTKTFEVPKLGTTAYSNRFLEEEDSGNNSAHAALMNALGSPRKKQRSGSSSSSGLVTSPRRGQRPPPIITEPAVEDSEKKSKDAPSEVEAIETLMSLSSPKKASKHSSQDFTLPPPPIPASRNQQPASQQDPTIVGMSSRSSSSGASIPNTLAEPFILKGNSGANTQVLLDVETDVEESNGD
ncbi:LAFA_0E19108g1_1 [Lachancea sp. 'fantastica']|nr:LAFA_0E19108g1_1 [Lachancea sp. 'fantastica']